MSRWLPVALAAAAVATLLGLPGPGRLRLEALRRPRLAGLALPLPVGAGLLVGLAWGPVAGALALVAAVVARRVLAARRADGQRARERGSAPDALATLAAELRAGRSPALALVEAAHAARGGLAAALGSAAGTAELGGDVPGALLAGSSAVPEVQRSLAACWQVCSAGGSGLAAAVERLEEGVRAGQAQRRAVESELAGPRATASLLAVLPLAGVALAGALGARPMHVLLGTPAGLVCLTTGAALDALGVLWTRRLTAGALRS